MPPPGRPREDLHVRVERAAALASFAVPWCVSALGAGASMGWYDAAELSAAAQGVGVTHPPGHPLWVALASLAALVPVGTVPMRVAVASGLCLALVGRVTFSVALRLARAPLDHPSLDAPRDRALAPAAALMASLLASCGTAAARQAVRAEVYALAAALAVAVLGLATTARGSPASRARLTVLALALGGANHHFIALTTAPVALATLWERGRQADGAGRRRGALAWAALGLVGLAPYALLFLRADTAASMVRVRTLGDFVWTVTARAFQKNMGGGVPGTFGEHLLDVIEWVGASVTPAGLLMALVGAFATVRARGDNERSTAGVAARLVVLGASVAAARAALGFVAGNPDAAGYLAPCVAAVACFTAGFPTAFWRALRTAPAAPEGPSREARVALTALLVAAPLALPAWAVYASLRDTRADRGYAPDDAAEAALGPLPPRSVVLAYAPETVFRLRYAQRVEGERPDVTVVPVPFLPYPGMNNTLLARDPDLLPLVRDYLAHGEPRVEQVGALALARPVRLELHPLNVLAMVPYAVPRGMFAEVRGEPTTLASVRGAAAAHFAALDALGGALREEPLEGRDAKSDELVLWRSYNDAVFFAARGARAEAAASLRRALERAPEEQTLRALEAALAAPGEGPIDVAPFVVAARPPG